MRLGWSFEEGDTFHPEANVAKMHAGIPPTPTGNRGSIRWPPGSTLNARGNSRESSLVPRSSDPIGRSSLATGGKHDWSVCAGPVT